MTPNPLTDASEFLSPVLNRAQHASLRSTSIIGRLATTLPRAQNATTVVANEDPEPVISYAVELLKRVHTYLLDKFNPSPSPEDLISPKDHKTIAAVLDLITLEGIYPCLTPGLGVPIERRAKAIIPPSKKLLSRLEVTEIRDVTILIGAIEALLAILRDDKGEVVEVIKERCLVDVVAGCGELAFNPSDMAIDERRYWIGRWETLVEGISTPKLVPLLMSLIHPNCPKWFLAPVTSKLSTLPICRPNVIRHILQIFLAAPSSSSSAPQNPGTPDIPLDALAKASRLIGSVPRSVTPDEWFRVVTPQLLDLIRGDRGINDEGLKRAAAYVIAELLGKKSMEEVIDKEVVQPILKSLDPDYGDPMKLEKQEPVVPIRQITPTIKKPAMSKALLDLENDNRPTATTAPIFKPLISVVANEDELPSTQEQDIDMTPLVPESTLVSTLTALSFLLKSHPTPLIPEKLLKPVLLPLWGLYCISKERNKAPQWSQTAKGLLISYIKTTGIGVTSTPTSMQEKTAIESILYNLGFTGGDRWEFGNGEVGGIDIRRRMDKDGKSTLGIEAIDLRVNEFMCLIQEVGGKDGEGKIISSLFLHIMNDWLDVGGGRREENPVRVLIRLKILQQILTNHTDQLGKNPTETLQVIKNILDEFVASRQSLQQTRLQRLTQTSTPSLSQLGKIVDQTINTTQTLPKHTNEPNLSGGSDEDEIMDEATALESSEETDSVERMTITLSLLSSMIANPETKFTEQDERLLQTLKPSLQWLSTAPADLVDSSITSLAINISSFLSLFETPEETAMKRKHDGKPSNEPPSFTDQQRSTYKTALSYLTDPMVPIRAHGLYLLRQLILSRSPILDIPTIPRLLISMIKDPDSFVYLNVVKCLQSLSEKHPSTVVKLLVSDYMDDTGGKSLDERLRIGESLLGTVEKEGKMLVGEVAQSVAQGMIDVVSRRRRREEKRRENELGPVGDEVKESLEAMKPPRNPFREQDEPEEEKEEQEEEEALDESGNPLPPHAKALRQHHLHIIKNWLPPPGTQLEDIRIRTSALSILSAAVETNPLGIGPRVCEMVLDMCLAILQLETTVEKAILRRAATVCIASLLKGWDQPGQEWLRRRLDGVKTTVGYVQSVDGDGLVREQARQVVEMIDDVWLSMMGVGGGETQHGKLMDGLVIGNMGLESLATRWG